jgi:hypothetical protein
MLNQSPHPEQEAGQRFPKIPLETGRDLPIVSSWRKVEAGADTHIAAGHADSR